MKDFFAVVSYPRISGEHNHWIQSFRKQHDVYYTFIKPHFTLVFPVYDIGKDDFIKEIEARAAGFSQIEFEVRCAIRNNDHSSNIFHVLLVPDKGFSEIVLLHDHLYRGRLIAEERLDIDFVPHIGIGNRQEAKACKKLVDEVNDLKLCIKGKIDQLNIIECVDDKIKTIAYMEAV